MEKALSFNSHLDIAETAIGVTECLGNALDILETEHAPKWVRDVASNEGSTGWREFLIVELAPFINDAHHFTALLNGPTNGPEIDCFYTEYIPAFFRATRHWSHFRAQSARDVGVAISEQFALNAPIPFNEA